MVPHGPDGITSTDINRGRGLKCFAEIDLVFLKRFVRFFQRKSCPSENVDKAHV